VRSTAARDSNQLILGFATAGSGQKPLLLRGIGPTLGSYGVGGVVADPLMRVYSSGNEIDRNDDWSTAPGAGSFGTIFNRLGAFALPGGSRDSALLRNFSPGPVSVALQGPAAGGIALVEVYDADNDPTSAASRLVNLSARTQVGTGDGVLTAGFVVSGGNVRVLVRAVGATLANYGVSGTLADTTLKVIRNGTVIAENDDHATSSDRTAIDAAAAAVGAFALTSNLDSALLVELSPGAYSTQVSGYGNTTGIGLVEIYEVP